MSNEFIISDNGKIKDWRVFRDRLVNELETCYTEERFNKILTAILLSIAPSPKAMIETRKKFGIKCSKTDEKEFKKLYKEAKKQEKEDNMMNKKGKGGKA